MLVPPGNRAVKIAEKVVLACSVRGDPIPEILWTKNGRPVELSRRIQQLSNGSLVIYDSTVRCNKSSSMLLFVEKLNVHFMN